MISTFENAMSAKISVYTQEEMAIDEAQGFPMAYDLLCRTSVTDGPFARGPPLSFIPYVSTPQEALRVKELNRMFPVISPPLSVCSSENLINFDNLLWEQLDHLGNAGFDPDLFRVDCFGNVVYRHADSASPLAWDIDHWFPSSRGGKTVLGNLRILQWQVCEKKKNKLDFLIPWWNRQLGISVNQFLSIFVSKNSDFRSRAFYFLFPNGGGEELNYLQDLNLHSFPQNFIKEARKQGLAPSAIVLSQKSSETEVIHFLASLKNSFQTNVGDKELQNFRSSILKENNQSAIDDHESNPCLTISCARNSLSQRKEKEKKQAVICQLDEELSELTHQNDIERISLHELEAELIKRRRKVEKCRRLSEEQASYRTVLENMIRDAMHQNVVYKEQLRLNQTATRVLMARLESQRAACDSSENEVRIKYKQRDELERDTEGYLKQIPHRSHASDDFNEAPSLSSDALSKETMQLIVESQRAARDSSENEVHIKYKQKDELERHTEGYLMQILHRSHTSDDFNEAPSLSSDALSKETMQLIVKSQRAACNSSGNEVRVKYKQRDELERHTGGFLKQIPHRSHASDDFNEGSKHLEPQGATCDSSKNEICSDELERHCLKQIPHRSHIYDDLHEDSEHLSSVKRVRGPLKKELRVSFKDQEKSDETKCNFNEEEDHCQSSEVNKINDGYVIEEKSYKSTIDNKKQFLYPMDHEQREENEEYGKRDCSLKKKKKGLLRLASLCISMFKKS